MAYRFVSDLSLEKLRDAVAAATGWKWEIRDSHWYGDYLQARLADDVRVRIHWPRNFNLPDGKVPTDPPDLYFTQIDDPRKDEATWRAFESGYVTALRGIGVRDLERIPGYD